MKLKTKLRLKFYLSLLGVVLLTIVVGVLFSYLVFLGWHAQLGRQIIPYDLFMIMAAILFVMSVTDIYLFFHLVMRRQYW